MSNISRRAVIRAFPFIGAVAVAPIAALSATKHDDSEFVAIPREAYDAIRTWADAHKASVAAGNALADHSRAIGVRINRGGPSYSEDEKAESYRLSADLTTAHELVGPAREKMIFALLRATS